MQCKSPAFEQFQWISVGLCQVVHAAAAAVVAASVVLRLVLTVH